MYQCLYKIGHITKAIICLRLKVSCHAKQGDNSYSENRQFNPPKKTHLVVRMFFLLPFERNLCQNQKKKIVL